MEMRCRCACFELGAVRCSHARHLLEAQFTEACVFVLSFTFLGTELQRPTTGTYKSLSVEGFAENQEENLDMVANILSVKGFFLNVTVTLKVCPRLACGVAPKYDCRRIIAGSKEKTRTPTHGCIMSICHPDCPYFSKRTDFSRNVNMLASRCQF